MGASFIPKVCTPFLVHPFSGAERPLPSSTGNQAGFDYFFDVNWVSGDTGLEGYTPASPTTPKSWVGAQCPFWGTLEQLSDSSIL